MIKNLHTRRTIALLSLLFLIVFKINAQSPTAPEATAFEPVDVTDAVNLVTGDFNYTIPVLEVPGPEGGYPLTLSYHAGIAMEQEASWVGLGWSLNPGAINRTLNGYPDDWKNVKNYEYYWNKGETLEQHTVTLSMGVSEVGSVGLGVSWGSMRGFSGVVSFGVADFFNHQMDTQGNASTGIRTLGVDIAMSFTPGSGLSGSVSRDGVGVSYSDKGGLVGSLKISEFTIKTNGDVSFDGLGISLSSNINSGGFSIGDGSGASYFSTSQQEDDTTIKRSGFSLPPIMGIKYRYEKVKWYVDKLKEVGVSGVLYSDNNLLNIPQTVVDFCEKEFGICDSYLEPIIQNTTSCDCIDKNGEGYGYTGEILNPDYVFNDVNEINYLGSTKEFSILNRNPALLNYDQFNVSAQGLAGQMSPKFMKNISLVNVNHDFEEADLSYFKPENDQVSVLPNFYFENELVGGTLVNRVSFDNVSNPTGFDDYINNPNAIVDGDKKSGNFVEFFTYNNLPIDSQMPEGYVKPVNVDVNSIAGFRITSVNGIVYHYMLPVYSTVEKMRSFKEIEGENTAYSERTNSSYATHWLLTSITGPDYIDTNTDGRVNEKDLGYWVDFSYGKWSEGNVWRSPATQGEYSAIYSKGIQQYSWGIKELYYLDRISTRTHSALFVKEIRNDDIGVGLSYQHKGKTSNITPEQKKLKLDKIVLVKNSELMSFSKTNTNDFSEDPNKDYSFTFPKVDLTYDIFTNIQDNVLDIEDYETLGLKQKAIGVADFSYDYSLAKNAPNSNSNGKLTLKSLQIKGKKEVALIPAYRFSYSNNPDWKLSEGNYWGYKDEDATAWCLDEITTPIGTIMKMDYEEDEYENVFEKVSGNGTTIEEYNFDKTKIVTIVNPEYEPYLSVRFDAGNYNLTSGDKLKMVFRAREYQLPCDEDRKYLYSYDGEVVLENYYDPSGLIYANTFQVKLLDEVIVEDIYAEESECLANETFTRSIEFYNVEGDAFRAKSAAGIRVASLEISDGLDAWKTTYEYEKGSVPYEPYYDTQGTKNQSLLRSPNVLYGKVTVKNLDKNGDIINNIRNEYEFVIDEEEYGGVTSKLSTNPTYTILDNGFDNNPSHADSYDYKDYQSIIGNLKTHSVYQGQKVLSKRTNNYTFLDESSGFVNSEATQMYKKINPPAIGTIDPDYQVNRLISTTYTKYPVVLDNVETVQGGFKTITFSDKRDINTGVLLESHFYDSNGNQYKTEVTPAYTIPDYNPAIGYGMGTKQENITNKNMLVQEAISTSYMKVGDEWKETGINITTWNNNWMYQFNNNTIENSDDVWRKHKSYVWNGASEDGIYTDFTDDFNWGINATQTSDWKKISETTRYNQFSSPLEKKDVNNNYAATKMGDNYSKVIATSNAAYDDMYYSGAEYVDVEDASFFDGGVKSAGYLYVLNDNGVSDAHTGNYVVEVNSGGKAFEVDVPARTLRNTDLRKRFKVSVWVEKGKESAVKILLNNTQVAFKDSEGLYAGDWVLVTGYITIPTTGANVAITSISGTVRLDDFRLHPISSSMTSYVYNKWDEVSYITGANGLSIHYIYGNAGRLKETWSEVVDNNTAGIIGGFKKISANTYNYKNQ